MREGGQHNPYIYYINPIYGLILNKIIWPRYKFHMGHINDNKFLISYKELARYKIKPYIHIHFGMAGTLII